MPELPEVETVVRLIRPKVIGKTIADARFLIPRQLEPQSAATVRRRLKGGSILEVARKGKYILLRLDGGLLVIHLRMTGRLYVRDAAKPDEPYERAFIGLTDGSVLVLRDPRTLGTIGLYGSMEDVPALMMLGRDPLEEPFNASELRELLSRRSMAIKPVLLDQRIWAGIGNIYASEALWLAQIHPDKSANRLTKTELGRLIESVSAVLRRALEQGGSTLRDFMSPDGKSGAYQKEFRVYDREDEPCLRCGKPIRRLVQAQRSTYFCAGCQRKK